MKFDGPKVSKNFPGPKAKKIIERDMSSIVKTTKAGPLVARRASGAMVEDVDGNIFIDLFSGIGVHNLGHGHPAVKDAIKKQADEFIHMAGTDFYYDIQITLAEKLNKSAPGKQGRKVFFANSGTESVEAAIKVAKSSMGRQTFLGFINAFHGRTLGSLAFTSSKPVHRRGFFPFMPGAYQLPYAYCFRCRYKMEYPDCDIWCARILDEVYFDTFVPPEDIAAIIAEPIQGEGGYIVPPKEFLPMIRKITKKHGILYIDDEVQAGIGRTGRFWAIENFKVIPDIITSSKALGSGIPISATIIDKRLDFRESGMHSNTFGGNPIGAAAAIATVETINKADFLKRVRTVSRDSLKRLREMQERFEIIGDTRGLGLMMAHEFVKSPKTLQTNEKARNRITQIALRKGLIILGCGKSSMRYIPPLNIDEDLLETAWNILEESIGAVEKELK